MSSLNLPQLKRAPEVRSKLTAAGPAAGTGQPASAPPPLPPSSPRPESSGGYTLPLPPPPIWQQAMPTPTSLYPSAGTRVSDGLGIVGGLLFKLMMLLAANGIGFGVWWYTQGRYGTGELDGETAALAEELAEWEERAAAEQAAAEQAAAVVDEGHRIEAMFEAANNVDWPPVVLTGMVAGSSRNRTSAILNGVLVALHQTIEGIELIEVTDDGVVLEYEQTRKYIRVGEST